MIFDLLKSIFGRKRDRSHLVSTQPDPLTGKMQKVEYTPYFMYHFLDEENKYRFRIIVTLGNERLPEGYGPCKDPDLIDRVFEVNMLNDDVQAKVFTPISVSYDKGMELPFPEANITVEPQTQRVSPPVHDVIIPFATELDFVFKYGVNGKEYEITGVLPRYTNQQLSEYMSAARGG